MSWKMDQSECTDGGQSHAAELCDGLLKVIRRPRSRRRPQFFRDGHQDDGENNFH